MFVLQFVSHFLCIRSSESLEAKIRREISKCPINCFYVVKIGDSPTVRNGRRGRTPENKKGHRLLMVAHPLAGITYKD